MTDNGGGFGEGSGIFFAFLIFALFAFGGGAWGGGWGGQTRDIIAAITNGTASLSNKIDQNTISALQTENARLYADKSNLIQSVGFNERMCGLEKQLAACCCQNQQDLNLILAKLPTSTTSVKA